MSHTPDWNNAKLIETEKDINRRKVKETIHILDCETDTLNGNNGDTNQIWSPIIQKKKEHPQEELVVRFPPLTNQPQQTDFQLDEIEYWIINEDMTTKNTEVEPRRVTRRTEAHVATVDKYWKRHNKTDANSTFHLPVSQEEERVEKEPIRRSQRVIQQQNVRSTQQNVQRCNAGTESAPSSRRSQRLASNK